MSLRRPKHESLKRLPSAHGGCFLLLRVLAVACYAQDSTNPVANLQREAFLDSAESSEADRCIDGKLPTTIPNNTLLAVCDPIVWGIRVGNASYSFCLLLVAMGVY